PLIEKGGYGGANVVAGPMPEFTPDGRFLVWESGEGALRLLSTDTGREVVRLESPDQGRCNYLSFSPDGRLLIASNGDYPALHVWALQELRRQLKGMDLDWDAEPYAAAPEAPRPPPRPLQVQAEDAGLGVQAQKRADALALTTRPGNSSPG